MDQDSIIRLQTCDERLIKVITAVSAYWHIRVIEGHRGRVNQDAAYSLGKSKLLWPKGKHNGTPSLAVDVTPEPIDWNNDQRLIYFAGFVIGMARKMDIDLRWGGDWNGWQDPRKNQFKDLVHFEIKT